MNHNKKKNRGKDTNLQMNESQEPRCARRGARLASPAAEMPSLNLVSRWGIWLLASLMPLPCYCVYLLN